MGNGQFKHNFQPLPALPLRQTGNAQVVKFSNLNLMSPIHYSQFTIHHGKTGSNWFWN